jgi:hypothetical protein
MDKDTFSAAVCYALDVAHIYTYPHCLNCRSCGSHVGGHPIESCGAGHNPALFRHENCAAEVSRGARESGRHGLVHLNPTEFNFKTKEAAGSGKNKLHKPADIAVQNFIGSGATVLYDFTCYSANQKAVSTHPYINPDDHLKPAREGKFKRYNEIIDLYKSYQGNLSFQPLVFSTKGKCDVNTLQQLRDLTGYVGRHYSNTVRKINLAIYRNVAFYCLAQAGSRSLEVRPI